MREVGEESKKRPLTRFKIGEMFLGLVGLSTEVVGGSFSQSKEQEDRGLIYQGGVPRSESRHQNVMRVRVKRPPNRLYVSNKAVYFTWVHAG